MPNAEDVLVIARGKIGLGEFPPDSNHNLITDWYGADGPWCAMFVSWVLAHGGFSKDGGATLNVPGVVQTTAHGWSYVPYLLASFKNVNRTSKAAAVGAIVAYDWNGDGMPDHTGIVEAVPGDGTIIAIEGNRNNAVERVHREGSVVEAYCLLPYEGAPEPVPLETTPEGIQPFPGYCFLGCQDKATRAVQQRLAYRGWHLDVDGIFGADTLQAVKAFQKQAGLVVDGIVGPKTWNALFSRVSVA